MDLVMGQHHSAQLTKGLWLAPAGSFVLGGEGNTPFSHSTQGKGLFSSSAPLRLLPCTGPSSLSPVHTAEALVQRKSRTPENSNLQLLRLFAKQKLALSLFFIPQSVVHRGFSLVQIQSHPYTASLLFLLSLHKRGPLPFLPMLPVLSLSIHKHTPLSHQAVSFHLWRSFCHSAD